MVLKMARSLKKNIDVEDLEYAVEYLVRLSYSPLRAGKVDEKSSIAIKRVDILAVALETEKLIDLAVANDIRPDFVERVDRCCRGIESVISETLNKEGFQNMRLGIRQMRHRKLAVRIPEKYHAALSEVDDEQYPLNI